LKIKNAVNNYFLKSIIAAFSINILILPVLSYYYGGFSLISILTNIASAPVFYILLLDLFISSFAAIVWFASGSFLIIPANYLMNIIIKLSEFFNSLPYGFIKTEIFNSKAVICLYYFSLIIIFASVSIFLKKRNKE
jgi:competence protein ComEC